MQCLGLGCSSSIMAVGEHEPVNKKINHAGMCRNRCMFSLPKDILGLVLGKLTILDYLSFRAVCRCWRQAFFQCQDLFQNLSQQPWIVFLKVKRYDSVQPALYTTGKLGHSLTRCVYNLDIPELEGSRFLLSKYGWLLLFSTSSKSPSRSSLFFLNPFCGSRIDLPFLDVPSLIWPLFSLSSPPTSQDCIIFVISCYEGNSLADVKINILHYGEDAWSTNIYPRGDLGLSSPVNVSFSRGTFYCIHRDGDLSAYSTLKGCWKHLTRPSFLETRHLKMTTSFLVQYQKMVIFCLDVVDVRIYRLRAESYCFCGKETSFILGETEGILEAQSLILGEAERVLEARNLILRKTERILEARETIMLDSFNVCSWFGICKFTEKGRKFKWRRIKRWSRGYDGGENGTTIAWLEPRLIHPTLNLRWGACA